MEHAIQDAKIRAAKTTADQLAVQFPEEKRGPGRPKRDTAVASGTNESDLWRESMVAAMYTYEAKTPRDLIACTKVADEYIKLFKARYK